MTRAQMWDRIEGLQGQRLATTTQHKPFLLEVANRGKEVVVIPESTKKRRPIKAEDVNRAYDLWQQKGQVRTVDLLDEGSAEWSSAYLVALMQIAASG